MEFAPRPENDFRNFIDLYYKECQERCPRIAAVAGKWTFEDLIPGLSDFDTRFIVDDDMSVDDWCEVSAAVGEVHLDICRRFPHWARNMEHLPGVNLTWRELTDPGGYYPEYPQWTFYETTDPARLQAAEQYLAGQAWTQSDEYFHLKKFCLYYGRYDRQIDPAVNLGPYENKYPLHSRFMHYFCPPVQSAVCLLLKRPVRGKMETVRLAREMFPQEDVFREMEEAVSRHYEIPELYKEPEVSHLEDRLEAALDMLRARIAPALSVIRDAGGKTMAQWRSDLKQLVVDPVQRIFNTARFSRLMKGRLTFYAEAPPHFDSTWPLQNEFRRMRQNFFDVPFGAYSEVVLGTSPQTPAQIVAMLPGDVLTDEEMCCVREFVRLLPGHWDKGRERNIARALAAVFDGFFIALTKITAEVRNASGKDNKCR